MESFCLDDYPDYSDQDIIYALVEHIEKLEDDIDNLESEKDDLYTDDEAIDYAMNLGYNLCEECDRVDMDDGDYGYCPDCDRIEVTPCEVCRYNSSVSSQGGGRLSSVCFCELMRLNSSEDKMKYCSLGE